MPNTKLAVIVNPKSANGKTGRNWPRLNAALTETFGEIQTFETRHPGHATELAAAVLRAGCETLIAIGGDGTIHEVVNGFFTGTSGTTAGRRLGIVPQGTGSDLRRTLRLPKDEDRAIRIIRAGHTRRIDLMRVVCRERNGRNRSCVAVNLVSFGMGGRVAARANTSSKILGGMASFFAATVAVALRFSGNEVSIRVGTQDRVRVRISNVAVGNGGYHGGGMWVCPRAVVDDGLLDVTVIEYLSPWEMFRNVLRLYDGRIYEHPKAHFHRATWLEAESDEVTLVEVDGEPLGQLPLTVTVMPEAIEVFVPPKGEG